MARRARNRRQKPPAPGWVWMLFGLSLGLVVAAGIYFHGGRAAAPQAAVGRSAPPPSTSSPGASPPGASPPGAATAATRTARGARPASATGPKPTSGDSRFDFYDILPQYEVVVPEVETPAEPAGRARARVTEPGSYVLQAGSFTALTDADRLKANIALLGIESRIQRVTIDDDVFHRVRIGPISDLDRLNRIRAQLHDAHIETVLMKAAE